MKLSIWDFIKIVYFLSRLKDKPVGDTLLKELKRMAGVNF